MKIIPSTSLRNSYKEISKYCKETKEPVYLTNKGKGDLVLMSIEAYEEKEKIYQFREECFRREMSRLTGEGLMTIEEFDQKMKEILK